MRIGHLFPKHRVKLKEISCSCKTNFILPPYVDKTKMCLRGSGTGMLNFKVSITFVKLFFSKRLELILSKWLWNLISYMTDYKAELKLKCTWSATFSSIFHLVSEHSAPMYVGLLCPFFAQVFYFRIIYFDITLSCIH